MFYFMLTIFSLMLMREFASYMGKGYAKEAAKSSKQVNKAATNHIYYRGRRGLALESIKGMTKVLFQDDTCVWIPSDKIGRA